MDYIQIVHSPRYFMFRFQRMRVPSERKLAQILIALLLLISPAHGKPLSSRKFRYGVE